MYRYYPLLLPLLAATAPAPLVTAGVAAALPPAAAAGLSVSCLVLGSSSHTLLSMAMSLALSMGCG